MNPKQINTKIDTDKPHTQKKFLIEWLIERSNSIHKSVIQYSISVFACLKIYIVFIWKDKQGTSLVALSAPANAGDLGSIPGSGRSPAGGNGNPLQYS